jgi:TetR/AcrR family transcriptional repressor of bet genes
MNDHSFSIAVLSRLYYGCRHLSLHSNGVSMAQARSDATTTGRRRSASKEERRRQLIKSTIKCIARNGLSATTMADVTSEAGLSLGIVNLHFQSKEKLLVETLRSVAEEYKTGWDLILEEPHSTPEEKILALISHDFSKAIAHRNKLAVWFAFWGEVKSRPTYQRICNESDQQTNASMRGLCEALISSGGYNRIEADLVATGYTALADGLWLDLLVTPRDVSREKAIAICHNYFRSFFPQHFSA